MTVLVKIDQSTVVFKDQSQLKEAKEGEDEGSDSNNASSSNSSDDNEGDGLTSSGERFEIIFDKVLYEAPPIVRQTHLKLEAIAKSQQAIKQAQTNKRW